MPSDPAVKPRQRLATIRRTWENAIVARTKYGPRSRLLRYPITRPAPVDSTAPSTSPIHGEMSHLEPSRAAE